MRTRAKISDRIREFYRNMDWVLFAATLALMITGGFVVKSATAATDPMMFNRQLIWYAAGLIMMFVFANINYNHLLALGSHLYWLFVAILILVLLVGHEALGAQRWIKIAGFQFQPSELMKIILPFAVIRFILVRQKESFTLKNIGKMLLMVALPALLILRQPDLGSALLILLVLFVIFYVGNMPPKKLIILVLAAVMLMPVAYMALKDYQRQRLAVFVNPQIDPLGAGYNVIQSQIAVGSGGLLGKGYMQGTQSQLNFIPIKYTDFVFAVITEETGFAGGLFIIALYFILTMQGLRIVKLSRYSGGKMAAASLITIIFSQFVINTGMNIGIMPVTGITLPLLSYGGTSVLVTMIAIGILQNIYREYMKAE
ncbi:MAG TPA: rod shape-determining protein RodA [bacterium]|nr:rod shape-determining protein RodA [bacterium]